jgi:hypothetical protein
MTNWCLSLPGDPAWWQTGAAILQVGLALAIFLVTRRYVVLTADLVKLQADVVKLQKDTERRDLYKRRIKVYEKTMAFLGLFAQEMSLQLEEIIAFLRNTRQAEFLFDADVTTLLDEIYAKAHKHRSLSQVAGPRRTDEQNAQINEAEEWLTGTAFEATKRTFGRYLRLVEPPVEGNAQ